MRLVLQLTLITLAVIYIDTYLAGLIGGALIVMCIATAFARGMKS